MRCRSLERAKLYANEFMLRESAHDETSLRSASQLKPGMLAARSMTLEYSSTRSTLWRWYWRSLLGNSVHRTLWLVWMLGAFLVGFGTSHLSGASGPQAALGGLASSLCVAALLAGYPQLRFKPQARVLTLLPDELSTTIRGETKKYSWQDVAQFEEDGGFVIIGLRNLNAFIVPPTAFRDAREREEMVEQGRAWWRGATPRASG